MEAEKHMDIKNQHKEARGSSKTALVTGSSRGIGLAVAEAFSQQGYSVALNCVNETKKMQEAIDRLKKENPNIIGIQADVSDYDKAADMFEQVESAFGRPVDILVNNAGISHIGLFQDMKRPQWDRILKVNFNSVLNCTHIALPHMISSKNGVIINISSIWGRYGASCESVYSASKGAVDAFTRSLGKELAPSGIRVNAIACGVIETEMNNMLTPEEKAELLDGIPSMRFGQPEEVAELALFLASDKAKYLTAQVITLDGGFC